MTATCRDIVRKALRRLSRIAAGQQPTGADLNDGMDALQGLYSEVVGLGAFGKLYDVVLDSNVPTYTAYEQQRIVCQNPAGISVTLPTILTLPPPWWTYNQGISPSWGCYGYCGPDYSFGWWCDYPRPPRDKACVVINDEYSDTNQVWLYNANLARWEELTDINPGDRAPMADRNSEGLANALAVRLSSEYGVQVPPAVARGEQLFMYAITHNYDSERTPTRVNYF